jgi:ABC-type glucose/galactose transport system permease subunit
VSRTARIANEAPALVVVAVGVAGIVAAAQHHWRKGLYVVAAALVLGALLRLVLPTRRAGTLAVRTKPVDVVTLLLLGAGVALLAGAVAP